MCVCPSISLHTFIQTTHAYTTSARDECRAQTANTHPLPLSYHGLAHRHRIQTDTPLTPPPHIPTTGGLGRGPLRHDPGHPGRPPLRAILRLDANAGTVQPPHAGKLTRRCCCSRVGVGKHLNQPFPSLHSPQTRRLLPTPSTKPTSPTRGQPPTTNGWPRSFAASATRWRRH